MTAVDWIAIGLCSLAIALWISFEPLAGRVRRWRTARAHRRLYKAVRTEAQERIAAQAQEGTPFLGTFLTADPSSIPDFAKSGKWEAHHLFSPYGRMPRRDSHGVHCTEPPLAMTCPECDLKMPAMQYAARRSCRYCGLTIQAHGTRLYWWREGGEA